MPSADLRPADAPAKLLVFDSGLGGLSVLSEIRLQLPLADIVYVADDAAFPYGGWAEPALIERVVVLMGELIADHRPDIVVIACNTASTLVLAPLRTRYSVPFVGTVPAIKTASHITRTGLVSVLATPGTVRRDYTRALIDTFASHRHVTLVGSERLAAVAELHLRGQPVEDAVIAAEIAPCFQETDGLRTDAIVLGCTHYPFLIAEFRRLSPWAVIWIDPAPAIARRVVDLLARQPRHAMAAAEAAPRPTPRGRALSTAGRAISPALVGLFDRFGLDC